MILTRVGRLFPRNDTIDAVGTCARFEASSETVWQGMLFYEEVPRRPMPLLRMFLPVPIRTQGDKTSVGAIIQCTYEGGYLEKRITAAERGSLVEFDVVVQQLGIEDAISMRDGSYELRADGDGCAVLLTTRYSGRLRPRWLWRPIERFLARRMHDHILCGMRAALQVSGPERNVAALGARG